MVSTRPRMAARPGTAWGCRPPSASRRSSWTPRIRTRSMCAYRGPSGAIPRSGGSTGLAMAGRPGPWFSKGATSARVPLRWPWTPGTRSVSWRPSGTSGARVGPSALGANPPRRPVAAASSSPRTAGSPGRNWRPLPPRAYPPSPGDGRSLPRRPPSRTSSIYLWNPPAAPCSAPAMAARPGRSATAAR